MAAGQKVALIGNNGSGKSTLLRIMAGHLQPSAGHISQQSQPYYIPQMAGSFRYRTVADALQVASRLRALENILGGDVGDANFSELNDDWNIVERCRIALNYWGLNKVIPTQPFESLSGGQKMRVLLAGISLHEPQIVLLDEPTNHLDTTGRHLLYQFIQQIKSSLVVVSHDRTLLKLMPTVNELSRGSLAAFGGNYEFYTEQKAAAQHALEQQLDHKERALRKARETERETLERQQKREVRGRGKQEKAGLPTIMMNTYRNNAEGSSARLKATHTARTESIREDVMELRSQVPDTDAMKLLFKQSALHNNKFLVEAKDINFQYNDILLWVKPLSFEITSRDRVAIKGNNGSGKTTLIKMILGASQPAVGHIYRAPQTAVYIDQDYSLISDSLSLYDQVQQFNDSGLMEHELKIRLTRFLFTKEYWDQRCGNLSGGEKMRLLLCCLTISGKAPDMLILDEPTNNLDIQNVDILAAAMAGYDGAVIVVSHDAQFLSNIRVTKELNL